MFGLGWVGKFGSVGAVGSANGPAAQGDIVQWLQGGTTDGLTLIDKKNVLTEPEIVDVNCLSFNGSTSRVLFTGTGVVAPTEVSHCFWAKTGSTSQITKFLFQGGTADTSNYIRQQGSSLMWRHNGVGSGTSTIGGVFTDTEWHHIVISWDGTNVRLFKDGVQVGSSISATGALLGSGYNQHKLGVASSAYWLGKIAQFRIYRKGLDSAESTLEMHNQYTPSTGELFSDIAISTEYQESYNLARSGGSVDGFIGGLIGTHTDVTLDTADIPSTHHSLGFSKYNLLTMSENKLHVAIYPAQSNGYGTNELNDLGTYGPARTTDEDYPIMVGTSGSGRDGVYMSWINAAGVYQYTPQNMRRTANYVGPELRGGAELQNQTGRPIFITKHALGGQPIDTFIKGTQAYTNFTEAYNKTNTDNPSATTLDVIWWVQGESGAVGGSGTYQAKMEQLITDMITDFGHAGTIVVFAGIGGDGLEESGTAKEINDIFRAYVAANPTKAVFFDCKDLERMDGAHYYSDQQLIRGQRFADSTMELLSTTESASDMYVAHRVDGSGMVEIIPPTNYGRISDNPAGYTHNRSECGVLQTDAGILQGLIYNYDSTPYASQPNTYSIVSERAVISAQGGEPFFFTFLKIHFDTVDSKWKIDITNLGRSLAEAPDNGKLFPPKTGWTGVDAGVGVPHDLEYDSFWVTGGEFVKKSIADFDAHYLVNGHYNLWLKFDEDGFVEIDKSVQYPLDKVFTVAEATRNLRYFGSGSVPEYDVDGNIVLDVNGFISYPA